jgi:HAL2 family 3'(2'),5'-bisphosphate nucleotidase
MAYNLELDTAINTVVKASRLCRDVQNSLVRLDTVEKADRSPVTIADLGSQAVINLALLRSFPNDPIVSEEDANTLRSHEYLGQKVLELVNAQIDDVSQAQILEAIDYGTREIDYKSRFWTVDPIDGTKGFLRGEQYAIALALVEDGQVVLSVLGCPNFPLNDTRPEDGKGCLFATVKGNGAFMQGLDQDKREAIHVDSIAHPREARFAEPVEKGHASHAAHAQISSALGITTPPYRMDSQCKYAAVARGDVSIYLRLPKDKSYQEKIWDHAAGSLMVSEAGGRVTDIHGRSLDFSKGRRLQNNEGVVATNGKLHEKVLNAIANPRARRKEPNR